MADEDSRVQPNSAPSTNPTRDEIEALLDAHEAWLTSERKLGCPVTLDRQELASADFTGRDLRGIALDGCIIDGADLRGANLCGANLVGASLRNAQLSGARFEEADLRLTDLTGAQGLQGRQFSGANLDGATFQDEANLFESLKIISEISKNSRSLIWVMILASLYSWLTIANTRDAVLLTNSVSHALPIIDTEIPVTGFFIVAPAILLAIFAYCLVYLQNLWRLISELPAVFPNGQAFWDKIYPSFTSNIARLHFRGNFGSGEREPRTQLLTVILSYAIIWLVVPFTLVLYWLRLLPRGDWGLAALQMAVLVLCVGFSISMHTAMCRILARRNAKAPRRLGLARAVVFGGGLIVAGASATLISDGVINGWPIERKPFVETYAHRRVTPQVLRAIGFIPFLDLEKAELSPAPPDWDDARCVEEMRSAGPKTGANLKNRVLRYANLSGARLVNADLSGADLRGSNLQHADLRGARLWGATLEGAVVHQADFRCAQFRSTNVDKVVLHSAKNITQGQLKGACSGIAQRYLPDDMSIDDCSGDRDWPLHYDQDLWPHQWPRWQGEP